jgi:type IV pilus assembly protein PilV
MNIKTGQSGATLIEVAVTVLLLSTCLLSMAVLQKRSLQFNQGAAMRSQANIYAYDMLDRIRINRTNYKEYNVAYGATPTGGAVMVADINEWRTNIQRYLPAGDGAVTCSATSRVCTVSIKWSEEHIFGQESVSGSDSKSELIYSSSL